MGGGVFIKGGNVTIVDSVITGNAAFRSPTGIGGSGIGGGLFRYSGDLITSNTALTDIATASPLIVKNPTNQEVIAGSGVVFLAVVAGIPPLRFQWLKDGSTIAGATHADFSITNAQAADAGRYTVIVTNFYGATTSTESALTVKYSLNIHTSGGGIVTLNPDLTNLLPNTVVTLVSVANPGYGFFNWSGDASGSANPLVLVMDGNKSVQANFVSTSVSLLVQGEGTVDKIPDKPFYSLGEIVRFTGLPGRWFAFTSWSDGVTNNPRLVTIGATNNYTAIFSPTTAVETLTFDGVSRTAPFGMPAVFVDGRFVASGIVTNLRSAQIKMTTTFTNANIYFTLTGAPPSSASRHYAHPFGVGRSVRVRAVAQSSDLGQAWEADPVDIWILPAFYFNAWTSGGGVVSVAPSTNLYIANTPATAVAAPASGWSFLQWLGDATAMGRTNSTVLNRDNCLQALFGTSLSNRIVGTGSILYDQSAALYPYGTVLRITAVPQPGNYFVSWGLSGTGTINPLYLGLTNANPTVSAEFSSLTADQVALTVIADGCGGVAVNPRANRFASGQSVTLTAQPDAEQIFLGWSGDGSGAQNPLTVLMDQSRVVTATFTKRPRLQLLSCFGAFDESALQLTLTGNLGDHYQMEVSEDLQTSWTTLAIVTNAFGTLQYNDTFITNRTHRFYRATRLEWGRGVRM